MWCLEAKYISSLQYWPKTDHLKSARVGFGFFKLNFVGDNLQQLHGIFLNITCDSLKFDSPTDNSRIQQEAPKPSLILSASDDSVSLFFRMARGTAPIFFKRAFF